MKGSAGRDHGETRDNDGRTDSYLICATPRTGSTRLCGLLASTGLAGQPESYFRQQDERSWASRWNLRGSGDGTFGFTDYLEAALAAGRTENGVFAARVMWGTLDQVVDRLRSIHPEQAGSDIDVLHRAFGTTRFVHLRRGDVVGQAVSWMRAEQTGVWQETDLARPAEGEKEPAEPHLDVDRIDELVQTIGEHNDGWREWFALAGVRPHLARYEDLVDDPIGVTRGTLDFLGINVPPGLEIRTRHRRLADRLNARWADQYRTLRGG